MKDFVCVNRCYIKNNAGKSQIYYPGDVAAFDKCPTHFEEVASTEEGIDFAAIGEEELLASDFEVVDLKDYIFETYGAKAGNKGREKTVEMLMEYRYREVDQEQISKTVI